MSRFFPFDRLGLRANPFRALTDEEWAELAVLPEAVLAAWASAPRHVQVLGPLGSGKTSTLLGLARRLAGGGLRAAYEYVPEAHTAFTTRLDSVEVFLLDEAQRLGRLERRRLLQQAGRVRLVLAAHEDLAALFGRHGQPLTTVRLEAAGGEHFAAVLARRLDYFAQPGGPRLRLAPEALRWLHGATGGNLRLAERWLYEVFQANPPPGELTSAQIRAVPPPPAPNSAARG